jgi:hypothetical protein
VNADVARSSLAAAQAELIQALAAQSAAPEGFDAARFQVAARALVSKRSRAAARAWPRLAGTLGEQWRERFRAFARTCPLPCEGGPLADGYAFARFLLRAGKLPDEGRLEALAVELRYRRCAAGGLRPRRGIAARVCVLGRPRRLILALRLPFLGERWLNLSYDRTLSGALC